MNFCGSVIDAKLTPKRPFLSSQQRNKAIKYLDLVCTDQIAEEDFLSPLKVHPTVLLGDLSSFGFQRPTPQFASIQLVSTRLYSS
ncbi:hypothetical protein G6F37_000902 [Rhizopus arrhizus]|nr:hypothetical protein G6F38_009418 [Rhizopus arrhizus]KAG1163766.1 hypothetical protein G6F37_000902 [Rhizopus arrhizus]